MDRIRESFDSLPVAICFFDKNGVVRLINHRMLMLTDRLRKNGIQTFDELEAALEGQAACVLRGTQAFAAGTAGFEETCGLLLSWTGGLIRRYGRAPQT